MHRKILARLFSLMILGGSLLPLNLRAQDTPSVAEAARRAREQKKNASKPAPVVTDDTLHPSARTEAPEGAAPAPPSTAESTPGTEEAAAAPAKKDQPSADNEEKKKAEIESLKQQITEQRAAVRLAQRELALQQDTFYSNPDYVHDKAGKDQIDSMKSDLQQKQTVLTDLQSKLAALGESEESKPASNQPQP